MNAYAPAIEITETTKRPGDEPLPGYRLMSPLGRGGFGEVWKCEAPGGLHKAIKFVPSDEANHSLRQEYDAFQQIKAIRHPFLLQLERVELTTAELIMVMELADTQLQERFLECRTTGLPGIPRGELLAYLADAAEALDVISVRHGLQHLDVKPANLFIICGRVKVGDYGLVRAETTGGTVHNRGFTPRYVAPEVLRGRVDARSDQYSLALVYQELLTGTFPYSGRSAQQMMMAHSTAAPISSASLRRIRSPSASLWRKNRKTATRRASRSCRRSMMGAAHTQRHDTIKPNDTATIGAVRLSRVQTANGYLARPDMMTPAPLEASRTTRHDCGSGTSPNPNPPPPQSSSRSGPCTPQPRANLVTPSPARASRTTAPDSGKMPTPYAAPPPQFSPAGSVAPAPPQFGGAPSASRPPTIGGRSGPPPASHGAAPFSRSQGLSVSRSPFVPEEPVDLVVGGSNLKIQLSDALLKSVLPITVLTGQAMVPAAISGEWFANTVMTAAVGEKDALGRTPDGLWTFRFRSTHQISVARQKLEALKTEDFFDEIIDRDATCITLRRYVATGLFSRLSGRKAGFELEIGWPPGRGGEVELTGRLFGDPDAKFCRGTAEAMPQLFDEIRAILKAGDERRKDTRVPVSFTVTLYPLKDDGCVLTPLIARCRNVSAGGLCFVCETPLSTRYAYVEFNEVPGVAGMALLTKMIRSQPNGAEHLFAGKFRTNL